MSCKNSARGFMLMEVMLAAALLGIGLVVIIQSVNASLRSSQSMANVSTASWLLEQKLTDVFQSRYGNGKDSGNFGSGWDNFRWETECRSLNRNLDGIILSIYWQERNEEKKISAETFIAKP
jgi:type II secretory pathway pseudopilin PulG